MISPDENIVAYIVPNSPAAQAGLRSGDLMISIDGHPINDTLDMIYSCSGKRSFDLHYSRDGIESHCKIKTYGFEHGIVLNDFKILHCKNKCIFCFIDQNAPSARRSLGIKDGDYRYSFLEGSYITLTDLSFSDFERIFALRLSPLYISVHATDENIRNFMLGANQPLHILEALHKLSDKNISFHAQIVLVPNVNDGAILEHTVNDLIKFGDSLLSLAIVPVGITRYREKCYPIKPVDFNGAKKVIDWSEHLLAERRRLRGILQLADEFFLLAGKKVPTAEYYGGFTQIENGVGMIRDFYMHARTWKPIDFKAFNEKNVCLVTGKLFAPILQEYATQIEALCDCKITVIAAENKLFGSTVTVANLLCGSDILSALNEERKYDLVVLPPRVLNADKLFLDDLPFDDFCEQIAAHVMVTNGVTFLPEEISACIQPFAGASS